MTQFEYSSYGYWVDPEGIIYAMDAYQNHGGWIFVHAREEGDFDPRLVTLAAVGKGWALITFAMDIADFAINFHPDRVTKAAIFSTQQILKEHDPDSAIHINDCLAHHRGYFPWRKAYVALGNYPRKPVTQRVNEARLAKWERRRDDRGGTRGTAAPPQGVRSLDDSI